MECLVPLDLQVGNHFVHSVQSKTQPRLVFHHIASHQPVLKQEDEDKGDLAGKKRRRPSLGGGCDSPDSEDNVDQCKVGSLRLTDAIDKLAAEEVVLKFDSATQLYIVLDGAGFEARFDEVRCTRAKRSDCSNSRPFSRMHSHYALVRGEKWAKTGSAFRAKDSAQDPSRHDQVHASKINVTLFPSDDTDGSQVTLQHFLNVTKAGDMFKNGSELRQKKEKSKDIEELLKSMQSEMAALKKGQDELRAVNQELVQQNMALRSLVLNNTMQVQLSQTNTLMNQGSSSLQQATLAQPHPLAALAVGGVPQLNCKGFQFC